MQERTEARTVGSLSAQIFSLKLLRQGFAGSAIIVANRICGFGRVKFEVKNLKKYGHLDFRCAVCDRC